MPCDTVRRPNQSLADRKAEVKATIDNVAKLLAQGRVKVVVGPQGAVAFTGLSEQERNRVTDACIYRRIMVSGSALAKAAIAKAEHLAGRSVNKSTVAHGVHSHDGGRTWHGKG